MKTATEQVRQKLLALADDIQRFGKHCDETEYTDTGEVWQVLGHLQRALQDAANDLKGE